MQIQTQKNQEGGRHPNLGDIDQEGQVTMQTSVDHDNDRKLNLISFQNSTLHRHSFFNWLFF